MSIQVSRKINIILFSLIMTIFVFCSGQARADSVDGDYLYTYSLINNEATITRYAGSGGEVSIPSTIGDNYSVTRIAEGAFTDRYDLNRVSIPESVQYIDAGAFQNCQNLTSVNLVNGLLTIGGRMYYGYDHAYYGLLYVGAFSGCTNLTDINIPDTVTSIGIAAFRGCSNLTNIDIPDNVISIGDQAFSQCRNLTQITMGNNITDIGNDAFSSTGITQITIPESAINIGEWAFGATPLTSVTIPRNVRYIGDYAFRFSGLNQIEVDPDNQAYSSQDGVLFNKDRNRLIYFPISKTGSYAVPDGVTDISKFAFENCSGLTSVVFPNSLLNIEEYAFYSCFGLKNVILPSSLKTLRSGAFGSTSLITSMETIQFESPDTRIIYGPPNPYPNQGMTIQRDTIILGYDPSTAQDYAVTYGNRFREIPVDCFDPFPANPDVFNRALALKAAQYSLLANESFNYNGINDVIRAAINLTGSDLDNGKFLTDATYSTVNFGTGKPTFLSTKLKQQGFRNIVDKNYGDNSDDKVAYVMATKTVYDLEGNGHNLVTVIIRGTAGNQWQGDMDITGSFWDSAQYTHTNFLKAEQYLLADLRDYVGTMSNPIFLITGHSRGAAVANILAEYITSNGEPMFENSPVYAYTFATPNVSTSATIYRPNIYNFCFEDDFVPQVPLNAWGYDKNGITYADKANLLFGNNQDFQMDMRAYKFFNTGAVEWNWPEFNDTSAAGLIEYINDTWPQCEYYYQPYPPGNAISLYVFFHDYLAPVLANPDIGNITDLASLKIMYPTYGKIIDFFTDGKLAHDYIFDTHNPYTYYIALKYGGFYGTLVPKNSDATLNDLQIDGTTIGGFRADTLSYSFELRSGTTIIPTISATVSDTGKATAVVTQAFGLPGNATVLVIAEDGITTQTYTINFTLAVPIDNDATLSDLQIDGTTINGFSTANYDYSVVLPAGTTTIPNVAATVTDTGKATLFITQASGLPGIATVVVTAEDGITTRTYTINFTLAAPTLQSIAITTAANKLTYIVGEPLDLTGLIVNGTYSDNSTAVLPITTANVTGFNSSAPDASQILTINYEGKTTTYTISVAADDPNAQAIRDFVTRFYTLCLNRQPDTLGLNYWVDSLAAGDQSGADVSKNFIFSPEFIARNLSDSDFLDIMYIAFFNRAADSSGKTYWQTQLNNGMSRLFILSSFVNSPEFNTVCNSYGITRGNITLTDPGDLNPQVTSFVNRFYVLCMDRPADSNGLNYWVGQLVSGTLTGADISQGFIFSPEFTAKNLNNSDFITVMYRVFFDREPDSGGQAYWVGQLDSGTSRLQVLAGFVASPEFATLCSGIGIPVGVVNY